MDARNDIEINSTINKRIERIVNESNTNLSNYAKKIGIAQTTLRECVKNNTEPKFSTIQKILVAEPQISAEWLLLGKGDMIKSKFPMVADNKSKDLIIQYAKRTQEIMEDKDRQIRELLLENTMLKSLQDINKS